MARKLEQFIMRGKTYTGYASQIGIQDKYSLCEACMKKKKPNGYTCGVYNTLIELGKEMGFYAPVFFCENFEKGIV